MLVAGTAGGGGGVNGRGAVVGIISYCRGSRKQDSQAGSTRGTLGFGLCVRGAGAGRAKKQHSRNHRRAEQREQEKKESLVYIPAGDTDDKVGGMVAR